MTINIDTSVNEKSSAVFTVDFVNELGAPVTPNSAMWTLHTEIGTVINSRQDVTITPLASSVEIVLNNDDLQLVGDDDSGYRYLLVEAEYDSPSQSGLKLNEQARFQINDFAGVPNT